MAAFSISQNVTWEPIRQRLSRQAAPRADRTILSVQLTRCTEFAEGSAFTRRLHLDEAAQIAAAAGTAEPAANDNASESDGGYEAEPPGTKVPSDLAPAYQM